MITWDSSLIFLSHKGGAEASAILDRRHTTLAATRSSTSHGENICLSISSWHLGDASAWQLLAYPRVLMPFHDPKEGKDMPADTGKDKLAYTGKDKQAYKGKDKSAYTSENTIHKGHKLTCYHKRKPQITLNTRLPSPPSYHPLYKITHPSILPPTINAPCLQSKAAVPSTLLSTKNKCFLPYSCGRDT